MHSASVVEYAVYQFSTTIDEEHILSLFQASPPAPPALANLRVIDLIDPICGYSRVEQVEAVFWPPDSECILGIPLGRVGDGDQLVWHYSKNGRFSVRSAYHIACSLEDKPCSSSREVDESCWWRKTLAGKTPKKVKLLVWLGPNLGKYVAPIQVTTFAFHYLESFLSQIVGFDFQHVARIPSSWQALSLGCVKINFDGVTFAIEVAMEVGVVARDVMGQCVAWLSLQVSRAGDGELVEALASREVLQNGGELCGY
ncbi:hypothetical protein Sango_3114800 [Sesamum angolense]|uniref:Uncharacterized protein n=1 Tax=Sesamum angolense TaxID=2727404 RepID=A0AAE1T8A4_9LAMI|nr:hypothetical protein Sango_3114800 [Sesamum angolense]